MFDVMVLFILFLFDGGLEVCFYLGSIVSLFDENLVLVYLGLVLLVLMEVLEACGFECFVCLLDEFDN